MCLGDGRAFGDRQKASSGSCLCIDSPVIAGMALGDLAPMLPDCPAHGSQPGTQAGRRAREGRMEMKTVSVRWSGVSRQLRVYDVSTAVSFNAETELPGIQGALLSSNFLFYL
jgi:hypothetical protein